MTRAHRPCLIGTTFFLVAYSQLSISTPPTPISVRPVSSKDVPLGEVAKFNFHEFGDLVTRDSSHLGANKVSTWIEFGNTSHRLNNDILYERSGPNSGEGSKHGTLGPIISGRVKQEEGEQLDHFKTGLPVAGDGEITPFDTNAVLVSRKRSREVRTRKIEIKPEQKSMGEDLKAEKYDKEPLSSLDQRHKLLRCAVDHKPGDFEIIILDSKWDPLLAWAKTSVGRTDESGIMKDFILNFEKKVEKIINRLPLANPHQKIEISNPPIDLFLADSNELHLSDYFEFLIQPKGLRGKLKHFKRNLKTKKDQIVEILEALGLFHGLSISYGVDKRILGNQQGNTLEDLVRWFWGILFEETEDGPPVFGWFKGRWEVAEKAGEKFGSIKKLMFIILAEWNWNCVQFQNIAEIAISLLGYWYRINPSLGIGLLTFNKPETYWNSMSKINESKRKPPNQVKSISIYENQDQKLPMSTCQKEKVRIEIFESIKSVIRKRGSGITQEIISVIKKHLQSYLSRSRFDLCHENWVILDGLPLYILPVSPIQGNSMNQDCFIGLRNVEEAQRSRKHKFRLLEHKIIQVIKSIFILHNISAKKLGNEIINQGEDFIQWFLRILFVQTDSSLPIFGWVKIQFPPLCSPENLFSTAQKYLSIKLSDLDDQSKYQGYKIAIQLFEFWFKEKVLESNPYHPNQNIDMLYECVLNEVKLFID
ncbi:hypothetical protein PGTUg99_024454 [Puccinia graminis f. sp. tritici]|uniref:Uncharacterized protein n=1 Tax=Puccinia graminis f. sp. tritici TaxID=56615 RepID=A0A5B0S9R5_PUCGR|nr:hypothetical protein PGTUg99_024454 [Puccinia graminis f. sp. tritici]